MYGKQKKPRNSLWNLAWALRRGKKEGVMDVPPIYAAVLSHDVDFLRKILKGGKVDWSATLMNCPVIFAAQEEYYNECTGTGDFKGKPKRKGVTYTILEMLLKAGADPNLSFHNPATGSIYTPYGILAESGLKEGVDLFLSICGARLNVMMPVNAGNECNKKALWPLQGAIAMGHTDIALSLLAHPSYKADFSSRPLHAAAEADNLRVLTFLLAMPGTAKVLNRRHPDPSVQDTPLSSACFSGHTCVPALLAAGADATGTPPPAARGPSGDISDPDDPYFGHTPMSCLLRTGANPGLIDALVAKGAKRPNLRRKEGGGGGSPSQWIYTSPSGKETELLDLRHVLGGGRSDIPAFYMGSNHNVRPAGGGAMGVVDDRMVKALARQTCATCSRAPDTGAALLVCGRCRVVFYCGQECQRKHWKAGHNALCKKPNA